MSHVTHIDESCHTYERVTSHIWMSLVTHMKESCHTYTCEWIMSLLFHTEAFLEALHHHVIWRHLGPLESSVIWKKKRREHEKRWISHATHMNESCHTCHLTTSRAAWILHYLKKNQEKWMSHAIQMNESCHTYHLTTSRAVWILHHLLKKTKRISHATIMNESCHTCHLTISWAVWILRHLKMNLKWMSHATRMNE